MMARVLRLAVVAGSVCLGSPALAADPAATLRGLNAEYDQALVTGDVEALDRIYSDDFTYTSPDGVLRSKAEQLAFVRAGKLGLASGRSDDVRVRVYGDFALITGRFNGAIRRAGATVAFRERYTTAWVKHTGRWVLVAEQGTIIK